MNPQNSIDKSILDLKVDRPDFAAILEESRKKKKFTDVQLQIGDQMFDAHRVVLAAYSPVFGAAVSNQWSTSKVVPISDEYIDPSIMEPLLHFLYTGSIQLTPDNVHPVCVAAHFLQIPSLLEPSVKHLCRMISVENVLSLYEFCVTCELHTLRFPCLRIIHKNHETIFHDPRILEFSSRTFSELVADFKALNRPRAMLKESTFDCIVRWTEVNFPERLGELPGLLKNIPLEELHLKFLTETVSNHPLVKESISCLETVSAVLANTQPKKGDNLVLLSRDGQKMSCYDSEGKRWRNLPGLLKPRTFFAVTVVNRKDIVVCGGNLSINRSDIQLDSVEIFEWASQTWKQLPRMPFKTTSVCSSIAAVGDDLYVIGKVQMSPNNEVVCYSFETQQWRYVKPMNIARKFAKLIEYDGYLYVYGGGTNIVERYDPLFDEWTCIFEVPKSTNDGQFRHMTVHENMIYACSPGNFEEFNPETNYWTQRSEWTGWGSITSMNGRLLMAKDNTNWIFKYSFTTKKWTQFLERDNSNNCFLFAGPFY